MDHIENIESYLAGTLEPQKRSEFESLLRSDENLKEEVEAYKGLISGIEFSAEKDFENEVAGWEKQLQKSQGYPSKSTEAKVIRPPWRTYLSAAAVVILLATLSYLFWPASSGQIDTNQLFTSNFQPYEDLATVKSGQETLINEAMLLYSQKQYDQAIKLYDEILAAENNNALILLYKGISYLAMKPSQTTNARESLQKSLDQHSDYADAAEWYLALTALQAGERSQATQMLEDILSKPGHDHRRAAENLLKKLK